MADSDMNSVPEPADDTFPLRRFEAQGRSWIARFAGEGAGGTGVWGLGRLHAVHFCSEADPEKPLFEALLPGGRLEFLFDEELRSLLNEARPIVVPAPGTATEPPRETRGPGRREPFDEEPAVDG